MVTLLFRIYILGVCDVLDAVSPVIIIRVSKILGNRKGTEMESGNAQWKMPDIHFTV